MEEEEAVKVSLDAGHGTTLGHTHTGAAGNGLVEDDVNRDMSIRVGHHLLKLGAQTVFTRPGAGIVAIPVRAKIARVAKCDLLLSLHCNAGPASAHGAEAFVVENDSRSLRVAERILHKLTTCGISNRGVRWDSQSAHRRLGILRGTYHNMPAVLVELGFLTNKSDSELLKDRYFLDRAARAIAEAVAEGK
jgi:N-acetylmuramoyl-L-alanine amidase